MNESPRTFGNEGRCVWQTGVALPVLACVYVVVVVLTARADSVRSFGDSVMFEAVSKHPIWTRAFLAALRPPVVPLLWKVLSQRGHLIALAQSVLSLGAWLVLGWVFSLCLRSPWLKIASLLIVWGLSLASPIQGWHFALLSESVSNSLFIALVAAWIDALRRSAADSIAWRVTVATAACLTCLWLFARDTNASLVVPFVIAALALAFRKRASRKAFLVPCLLAILAAALIAGCLSGISGRWKFPMVNVIAQRVLMSRDAQSYFSARGMPVNEGVLCLRGRWASSCEFKDAGERLDPANWSSLNPWLEDASRRTYAEFLATHPGDTLIQPWIDRHRLLDGNVAPYIGGQRPLWQWVVDQAIYLHGRALWLAVMVAVGLLIVTTVFEPAWMTLFLAGLLVGCVPVALIAWHSDTMEVDRHGIAVGLQLRLAVWLAVLRSSDVLIRRISSLRPRIQKS